MAFEIVNGVLQKYTEEPGVTEAVIPDSVTSIGSMAFYRCSSLTQITIPESVKSIGQKAFQWCSSLTQITIPEGVTSIGGYTFFACTGLTQITIPENVTSIGENAFLDCTALTAINVSENNPRYSSADGILYNKAGSELLVCPAGKTAVSIPERVTSIAMEAFMDCSNLAQLTIPVSVSCISSQAFWGCCKNLRVIRLHPDDPEIFRNYNDVDKLGEKIETALGSLRTGDYTVKLDHTVKYPLYILHYLHTKDEALGAYIKKNITKLMKAAITNDDLSFIQAVTQTDTFITKRSIDKFIQQALDEKQQRIWAYLADYKNRQFGIAPKDGGLL